MQKIHWSIAAVCALLFLGVTLLQQAPVKAAPAVVYGPPTMGTQVTLGENSIDGPALAGFLMDFPTGFPPGYPKGFPKSVLAWTGTDPIHRLNYQTSNDGLHYSNKHVLGETSLWRPGVALMNGAGFNAQGTTVARGEVIALAWTGTDAAHTLNLMTIDSYDFHVIKKMTLWGETSFTAPGVSRWTRFGHEYILLAWAGTDSNHTLNTLALTTSGIIATKQVLWGWSSRSRPDIQTGIQVDGYDSGDALLAWTGPDLRLRDAQSVDTVKWTLLSGTHPIPEWSNWAPSMIKAATNMPPYWLAWTGTDPAHSLNVLYTESFPIWQDVGSKAAFSVHPLGGPEMAYVGVTGQVIVAWAARESGHLLHVAVINVTH